MAPNTAHDLDLSDIEQRVTALQKRIAGIHRNPIEFVLNVGIILLEGGADYTTAVDRAVEKVVKPELLSLLPGSGFIGEDSDPAFESSRYVWIVDPTDGTAVYSGGGEYYSSSIALIDRQGKDGAGAVVFGSVFQSATGRQFLRAADCLKVREHLPQGVFERHPRGSASRCFGEYLGCSFGTSKHLSKSPGLAERLKSVFSPTEFREANRTYSAKDARPASGSSALFCCDIADGNRHFALLFFQKAWDLAVGAVYARQAGCPVVLFDQSGNIIDADLEHEIAGCTKSTMMHVGVFANEHVKGYVLGKFNADAACSPDGRLISE